jgi:nicotinamidase-related amidase
MLPSSAAALLVIDVQQAIDHPSWGERNNPQAEWNIAALLAACSASGRRHLSRAARFHGAAIPLSPRGSPGTNSAGEAMPHPRNSVVAKRTNSAFIGTDLESRLRAGAGVEL